MDDTLLAIAALALKAAHAIMDVKARGFAVVRKLDASPVTDADMAAHAVIMEGLQKLTPDVPIISEENAVQPEAGAQFWCVDPLDGTRSFARGQGEFTVNIALVENGCAMLGVIACPLDGSCYAGRVGAGAWRMRVGGAWERISVSGNAEKAIIGSHYVSARMKELLATLHITQVEAMSSARKFCVVAEGAADVYPRFAPTYEWDTAAGQALVEAAGGRMTTLEGAPFVYGKMRYENGEFIAWGNDY